MPRGPRLDAPGVLPHVMMQPPRGPCEFRRRRGGFETRPSPLATDQGNGATGLAMCRLSNHVDLGRRPNRYDAAHRPAMRIPVT